MATLLLKETDTAAAANAIALRSWLEGDWLVLFSHAADFARLDWEGDRWLSIVRRAFAQRGTRPVALARPAMRADGGWVNEVSGQSLLALTRSNGEAIDLRSRTLRDDIVGIRDRFVMVIDAGLRRRRTFAYSSLESLPSPLEFLGWVDALRGHEPPRPAPRLVELDPLAKRRYPVALRAHAG
jgi:hypothetical protein